jgi:hypothetical protein
MLCVRTWPYQSRRNRSRVAGTGTDVGQRPRSLPPPATGGAHIPIPILLRRSGERRQERVGDYPSRTTRSLQDAGGCEPLRIAHFRWLIGRRANGTPIPGGRSYYRSVRGAGGKVPPRPRGPGRGAWHRGSHSGGARDTLLPVTPAAEDNFQPIDAPVRTVGPATPQGSREVPPVISPRRPGAHASPSLCSSGDERLKAYSSGALSDAQ